MPTGVPPWLYSFYDRVVRRYPRIQYFLNQAYELYLNYYMQTYIRRNCVSHANVRKPDIIWIDPNEINEVYDPGFRPYRNNVCQVMSGNWDKDLPDFEDVFPYSAFQEHYLYDVPWEQTEMYSYLENLFNKNKTWHGCSSLSKADEELRKLDKLYQNIKTEGYKTQKEILESGIEDPLMDIPVSLENHERGEVTVNIGRDGKIILEDGRHRVAIAKLLNLNSIPVHILVTHSKFKNNINKEFNHKDKSDS